MSGLIAAGSQITADVGAELLQQGGNAVDAAVGAAFASFIAEVGVVHLGGSGFAQIYDPDSGTGIVYDFFCNAPGLGGAGITESTDFEKVTIDFGPTTQDFHLGRGSVAVPGNIFGLCQIAADYGRLPLEGILAPAIQLAEEGVILDDFQADTCLLLAPLYTHTPGIRQLFMRNGAIIQAGDRLFIPHLAQTLTELANAGSDFMRTGQLGQRLVEDQRANGGLLTAEDLSAYQVEKSLPIRFSYGDYELLLPPLSSTGGVLVAFSLKLLAQFPIAQLSPGSADHLRLLIEAMAATNRARKSWDRWIEKMPAADALNRFFDDNFFVPHLAEMRHAYETKCPSRMVAETAAPPNTSHLSVIDEDGLAVSLTTTAGESAGYVLPETGFIPNNIMGEADLHPHGFHSRAAGERIQTMMTPTIALKNNKIRLVTGSGGSVRIRSAIIQTINNALDYQMELSKAVNAPRIHLEDGVVQLEAGFLPQAADELERLGYRVNRWDKRSIYFGGAHSVCWTSAGQMAATGDNRRGGATAIAGD